jgi:hypothetical protein
MPRTGGLVQTTPTIHVIIYHNVPRLLCKRAFSWTGADTLETADALTSALDLVYDVQIYGAGTLADPTGDARCFLYTNVP